MMMMISLANIVLAILLIGSSVAEKNYTEIPLDIELTATNYSISSFSPKTFVKSAEFELNATQCVQFSFKLLEKRTKLHAYTCQLSEGGFCTLDKFYFPRDRQGCTYLRPWTHKDDTWSFYFILEKRERVFGRAYQLKQKKMRRNVKRSLSTQTAGLLQLYGVVPCSEACKNRDEKLGSQSDGTFYRGRDNRIFY